MESAGTSDATRNNITECPECKRHKDRPEACEVFSKVFCEVFCKVSFYFLVGIACLIASTLVAYYRGTTTESSDDFQFVFRSRESIPLLKTWRPWFARPNLRGNAPRILLWPAAEDGEQPLGAVIMQHCLTKPERQPCYLARHKQHLRLADAIVFDASRMDAYLLPTQRHASQMWVLSTQNISLEDKLDGVKRFSDFFNWTMSLRDDGDVVIPYGNWTSEGMDYPSSRERLSTAIKGKSRNAALFVSDCEAATRNSSDTLNEAGRVKSTELFVKQIAVDVEVTVFTGCGRPLCGSRKECLEMVAQDFYFIFVFETSPCFQNPVELIYDSFNYDIVPVYFGKPPGLGSLVPPGSVYDTTNDATSFDISDKLVSLRADTASYLEYLLWKDSTKITAPEDVLCRLCDALYVDWDHGEAVCDDVVAWWKRRTNCTDVPAHRGGPIVEVELLEPGEVAAAPDAAQADCPWEAPSVRSSVACETL